jgi:hypothetical protein
MFKYWKQKSEMFESWKVKTKMSKYWKFKKWNVWSKHAMHMGKKIII